MDVRVGDEIELELPAMQEVLRTNKNTIRGEVVGVFDALTPTGETGINLEIDIRFGPGKSQWFRYKPMKDGGCLKVLNRR